MTWLTEQAEGETAFERALGLRPELFGLYRAMYAQLWSERLADPVVLELCRLRIAQLHGAAGEQRLRYEPAVAAGLTEDKVAALRQWATSPMFTATERACLAYAEQLAIDVHGITDAEAAAVLDHLGPAGNVAFTLAVGLFDGLGRFRVALDLDGGGPGAAEEDEVVLVAGPRPDGGTLH